VTRMNVSKKEKVSNGTGRVEFIYYLLMNRSSTAEFLSTRKSDLMLSRKFAVFPFIVCTSWLRFSRAISCIVRTLERIPYIPTNVRGKMDSPAKAMRSLLRMESQGKILLGFNIALQSNNCWRYNQ